VWYAVSPFGSVSLPHFPPETPSCLSCSCAYIALYVFHVGGVHVRVRMCVCVCEGERERVRERERERVCACLPARAYLRACVRGCPARLVGLPLPRLSNGRARMDLIDAVP
jgi:hypothetical protein